MSGASRAVPLPFCGETDLWPHEVVAASGEVSLAARQLGVPRVPARLLAHARHRPTLRGPRDRRDHDHRAQQPRHCTDGPLPEELRELVSTGAPSWSSRRPETSSEWAVATFGERCITSSMGDAVLADPGLEGRAGHRRGLPRHRLPLRRDHRHPRRRRGDPAGQPADDHAVQSVPSGTRPTAGPLPHRPDLYCQLRKVQPLADSLASYDAWATGLRRARPTTG